MAGQTLRAAALVLAFALAACNSDQPSQSSTPDVPLGTGFDHYLLALSWSPGYCASEGERANREQCGRGAPDFGFVVHGLWPQFERGWPQDCDTDYPLSVSRDRAEAMGDIMPSTGLVRHQWRKHGTCSGLNQRDYFEVTRAAFERIAIPEAFQDRETIETLDPDRVEDAFRDANPRLPADAVAVTCDRRFLRDVRICLSRDLSDYVSCPEVDRRDCRLDGVVVPPDS